MRQRVGEARAVHVQLHAVRFGERRDLGDFLQRVDGAGLGRLRDADHGRLRAVHVAFAEGFQRTRDRLRRQLAVLAFDQHELGAMRVEFHRAAFVHRDMRMVVTDDRAVLRAERGQRQRIGRRAGHHREDRDVAFEDLRHGGLELRRQRIVAIGGHGAGIRGGEGLKDFGGGAIGVVAGEIHALCLGCCVATR